MPVCCVPLNNADTHATQPRLAAQILGDNTDVLVEAVLGKLRPGVVTGVWEGGIG
jgi:hypothetical protein